MNEKTIRKPYLLLMIALTGTIVSAQEETTKFDIYGFGRTNFTWANQDLGRSDLFIPANILFDSVNNPEFFIGARQTRLGIDFVQTINGTPLTIKLEGDFHDASSDANGMFRMRHAYANYKWVLVGMTWSNFFDPDGNPVMVDFEGPNSSTLSRSSQIRFSTTNSKNHVLSISFENPIEKVTVGGPITVLDERYPDIIGAYKFSGDFGFLKLAALYREIRYHSVEARSLPGYGLTLLGNIHTTDKDRLRFQGVMGTGVAKYIEGASALNYDAIYDGTNELQALSMYGGHISYQHFWKDNVYSSITGGYLGVQEDTVLTANNYLSGLYGGVNVYWTVVKNFTFGWEVLYGVRTNIDEASESALRVHMNATYKFNKTIN